MDQYSCPSHRSSLEVLIQISYSKGMSIDVFLFVKGLITGFFISFLSVGGALFCTHYVLENKNEDAFLASLGIITVQFIWALIAVVVLVLGYYFLELKYKSFSLIGSIILFIMAIRVYRRGADFNEDVPQIVGKLKVFLAGVFISLGFPIRILTYFGIYAAINVHGPHPTFFQVLLLLVGTIIGMFVWYLSFLSLMKRSKDGMTPRMIQRFHKIASIMLIAFSIVGLLVVYL